MSYLEVGRGVTQKVGLETKEVNVISSLEIQMAFTVSMDARLKGAIVELITPSYCSDPSMKRCGFLAKVVAVDMKKKCCLFPVQTDALHPRPPRPAQVPTWCSQSSLAHHWFSVIHPVRQYIIFPDRF